MKELNLLEYLIPGIEIYSIIHQSKKTVLRIEPDSDFPIAIGTKKKGQRPMYFNQQGSVLKNGTECLLYPDKEITTWEGYVTPIRFDRGEIVKAIVPEGKILIAIYSHFDKDYQLHYCFHSIDSTGSIEYIECSQVDKFRKNEGYFFAKKIYSKMDIGRISKQI